VNDEAVPDDAVRVVVVDDVHDAAEMLAGVLRLNGYKVWAAHGGQDALDLIELRKPHCVMFDIDMPGIDGLELSRRLRERYCDDIVLIAVTGWDIDDRRVSGTFEVVDHYLRKPVDPAQLRKVLPPLRD
jgi:CheY-like chemotaxis protein